MSLAASLSHPDQGQHGARERVNQEPRKQDLERHPDVLAVAGAAREHTSVLIIGLVLSIALMGFASTFIARLLTKHRWIAYVGLFVILYIAVVMMWDGALEIMDHV